MNKPLVSIIIPTYNSEKTLEKCLESIKNQTCKNIEVIVVDNFSKDRTIEISKEYHTKLIQKLCNKPEARNIGILNAKDEYILLLDSDMVLETEVIEESIEKFQKENCEALFIDEEYENKGFWRKCRNLEKIIYKGNKIIEAPRFFKKDIFQKVLFDEKNEGPDEYDFYHSTKKFGLKEGRINSKVIILESPFNFKKKFHHGKFFFYYRNKHRKEKLISKQVNFFYRIKILLKAFKLSLIHSMGLFVIKFLEYLSFRIGCFTSYFDRKILRLLFSIEGEFDNVAETYEKEMFEKSTGSKFINAKEKEAILSLLKEIKLKNGAKILDVGPGNGRFSKEFLRLGYDVTALDISPNMCKYLKNNIRNLRVINEDIANVDSLDEKFDLIFSFRAFKYVRNKKRAIYNIKNLLKKNGYSIIEMPNLANPFYFFPYALAPFLIHFSNRNPTKSLILADFITTKSFTKELKKAGLKVERIKNLFCFPHALYSKIENKGYLKAIYGIGNILSKLFPRSLIFVVKNE